MNKMIFLFCILFALGCTNLTDPFVGKWQYYTASSELFSHDVAHLIEIEKVGSAKSNVYKAIIASKGTSKEYTLIKDSLNTLKDPTSKIGTYFALGDDGGLFLIITEKIWIEYKRID